MNISQLKFENSAGNVSHAEVIQLAPEQFAVSVTLLAGSESKLVDLQRTDCLPRYFKAIESAINTLVKCGIFTILVRMKA